MNPNEYPELHQLLAGYFYQCWYMEYSNWRDALNDYLSGTQPECFTLVVKEIDTLLNKVVNGKRMSNLLLGLDCYYDPQIDGMSDREWISLLRKELQSFIESKRIE